MAFLELRVSHEMMRDMQSLPPSLLLILRTANQAALLTALMIGTHDGESHLDRMRRRRNRLEYPEPDDLGVTTADSLEAIE